MKPLVSVIMPVYNSQNYLNEAINSVLNQAFKKIELIIINDASSDKSLEIINDYVTEDNRIRLINLRKNTGPGSCRNRALKKALGDYIMFLDADDFLELDAIQILYDIISKRKVDIILFGYKMFWEDLNRDAIIVTPSIDEIEEANFYHLFILNRKGFGPYPWSYIYKRNFILKNKIDFFSGSCCVDVPFTAKALLKCKSFKTFNLKYLYNYRRHPLSITYSNSEIKIVDRLAAYEKFKNILIKEKMYLMYKEIFQVRYLVYCIYNCFKIYFDIPKKNRNLSTVHLMRKLRKDTLLFEGLELIEKQIKLLELNENLSYQDFSISLWSLRNIKNNYTKYIIYKSILKFFKSKILIC